MEKSTIDFFLTKGKRKKERFFDPKNKKKKKLRAAVIGFFVVFLGQEIFFNIFQLLKKMSQLLCCFKRSGNFLKKKKIEGRARYGQGGDFYQTFLITIIQ